MPDIKKKSVVSNLGHVVSITKFVTDPEEEKYLKDEIIPKLHKSESE